MKLENFLLQNKLTTISEVLQETPFLQKLKDFSEIIARYEKAEKIHREDMEKLQTLKDFLDAFVNQIERRGE